MKISTDREEKTHSHTHIRLAQRAHASVYCTRFEADERKNVKKRAAATMKNTRKQDESSSQLNFYIKSQTRCER